MATRKPETTEYLCKADINTELSQSGARVNFCQKTYYGKVENAS